MLHKLSHIFKKPNKTNPYVLMMAVIVVGVLLRFYAMSKGHNFDFESYKIVGEIITNSGNVYAETTRYNYGPVWFTILGVFHGIGMLFNSPELLFRILIVGLLSIVDVCIALLLYKRYGIWAFIIFFLNPISIVITGYHNQFDNLAVLIGLVGLYLMPKPGANKITRMHLYSAILIGLSLMTKHIFFILPVWFFIRETHLKLKLTMLIIPLAIFAVAFVPFALTGGLDGILNNVFLYKSFANAPLLNAFVSPGILAHINPTLLMISVLIVVGFMSRRLSIFEAGLWYLLVLVAFSPAIANQYLAIVMPAVAALGAVFFIPFIVFAGVFLIAVSSDGMHVERLARHVPDQLLPFFAEDASRGQYKLIIAALFIGMILLAIYRYRKQWYRSTYLALRGLIQEQIKTLRK